MTTKTQTAKKLMLTSPRKMGKAKKTRAQVPAVDLKEQLQAAVEHAAAQAPAVIGLDGDAGVDMATIGELVKPVAVPARGLRQIEVTGADGKVRTAKLSRSQARRPAKQVKVEPAPKPEKAPLTEAECAAAGDAWINAKEGRLERYGLVEASTPVHGGKVGLTTTAFHDLEVDVATGKVRYVGINPHRPAKAVAEKPAAADHSETLFTLLSRAEGATARELMDACGLARSGTNAAVGKLLKARGLSIRTQKNPGADPADTKNTSFLYFV